MTRHRKRSRRLNPVGGQFSRRGGRDRRHRLLRFQSLESRQLLAGDLGFDEPLADITGMWITVGDREYFTSEQASVTVDMFAGETLQVTGIRYNLDETATPEDGVIAFESYVRREHGAAEVGSYDYTNGRFADPVDTEIAGGETVLHSGFESGWQLDVIDNRVAVVAIRYFEDEFVVEDRLLVDVNVIQPEDVANWTETISPVRGDWTSDPDGLGGDSRIDETAGLTVIQAGAASGDRYEIGVKAKTVEENTYANGFVVVDYRNENDFVYAGLRSIADQWVIGHFDGDYNDLVALDQEINPQQVYDLRVAVDGSHVALAADGIVRVSHDFDRSLEQGSIGLANQYAFTHFKNFQFFDNTDPEVAVEKAQLKADLANEASTAASNAAAEAERARQQAESNAIELGSAVEAAQVVAEEADLEYAAAVQAIADAEAILDRIPSAIEAAEDDHKDASKDVREVGKDLEDAEEDLEDLIRQSDRLEEQANELSEQQQTARQAAEQANQESQAAALAATTARKVSDEAEQAAEDAPKSERKAAEKIAKEADKAADKAEKNADEAAEEAEDANETLSELDEELIEIREEFEQLAVDLTEAEQEVLAAEKLLGEAIDRVEAAAQRIEDAEADRDRAEQRLEELSDLVGQLAEDAARAHDHVELAEQHAGAARESAEQAAGLAQEAADEALRLEREAATAADVLAAAVSALEALQAENDSTHGDFRAYALNFNHQDDGAFESTAGSSELAAGQLHLIPGDTGLAVSVLDNESLPDRTSTRVYTTVRADALPGFDQNGFIVFDYQSPDDFKYAGAWADTDKWAVGEVVDGQLVDLAILDEAIGEGPAYELQVWIEDKTLTLLVEGQQKLQHVFDQSVDDGQIGVASYNARSRFDQVAVMQLHGGAGDVGIEQADINPAASDAAINELF